MAASSRTIRKSLALFYSIAICQMAHAQSKTVVVTDPRPVAEAVEELEAIYGWPITYEDPLVIHESRLEDVTDRVQKIPDHTRPVKFQKEGTITFSYQTLPASLAVDKNDTRVPRGSEAEVSDALRSVLDGYSTSGAPETFRIVEDNGIFHIVPSEFLNKDGALQQSSPILDTRITILPKKRTRPELLREICQSLSHATGTHVGVGTFPNQGSESDAETTISGVNATARSLLCGLLTELSTPVYRDLSFQGPEGKIVTRHSIVWSGGPMSWELFYSPGWGYVLNMYAVPLTGEKTLEPLPRGQL